jgi:hypothetical protein
MSDPCTPNIGPRERKRRLRGGIAGAVLAVLLDVALVVGGSPRAWRAAVALPLVLAVYGFLQAFART